MILICFTKPVNLGQVQITIKVKPTYEISRYFSIKNQYILANGQKKEMPSAKECTGCPKKTQNANSALNLKHFTNSYA